MSKKKSKGLFSSMKDKLSKRYDESDENVVEDDSLTFSDKSEDDIQIESLEQDQTPNIPTEDEEEFVAQELTISSEEKQELEEMQAPPLLPSEGEEPLDLREESTEEVPSTDEATAEFNLEEMKAQSEEPFDQASDIEVESEETPAIMDKVKGIFSKKNDSDEEFFEEDDAPKENIFNKLKGKLSKSDSSEKPEINLAPLGSDEDSPVKKTFSKGFNFEDLVANAFSAEARSQIHKGFMLTLFATGTYVVGKSTALVLNKQDLQKPVKASAAPVVVPRTNFRKGLKEVKTANLFNSRLAEGEEIAKKMARPKDDQPVICKASSKKSKLSIKLINTIVLQDSVKSIASVQVRGKKGVVNIREGEKVSTMAEIGKIDRLKVVFKNLKSGECEYISSGKKKKVRPLKILSPKKGKKLLQKKMAGISNEGNNYRIKKSVREKMFSNMENVLTQARAIRIKNSDGSESYKMTEIVPGSIYSNLGVEDGDVITEINGKKIKNMNELMIMFGKLRTMDNVSITKLRNGTKVTSEYNFE